MIVVGTAVGYEHYRDEACKWQAIPFAAGNRELHKAERKFLEKAKQGEVIPLVGILLPAAGPLQRAGARLERSLAALRIVEALRAHAALHHGKLPKRLDEIAGCPIPLDPQTGQPFKYTLLDDRATLEAPADPQEQAPYAAIRYEISIVPAAEAANR